MYKQCVKCSNWEEVTEKCCSVCNRMHFRNEKEAEDALAKEYYYFVIKRKKRKS